MPTYPGMPVADTLDGTENFTLRQKGVFKKVSLNSLLPMFKGAKGDTGAKGDQGLKGDTGLTGPSPWIDLGTVTVGETMTVSVGASVRAKRVDCKGVVAGAPVTVFPAASMPTGFGISGAVSLVNDTVDVSVTCPALALGTKYSVSARVLVARA